MDVARFSYIGSRVYLSNPPGEDNALTVHPDLPKEIKEAEEELKEDEPEIHPLACFLLLCLTVGLTAATAEWVSSLGRVPWRGY